MTSNPLLLSTRKEEEAADTLLAALSTIAHVRPIEVDEYDESKYRSHFFYRPSLSFTEEIKERKKISLPKEVEVVDKQIAERKKTYQTELPPVLTSNIEKVREFWLKDIAPYTLAAISGSEQAKDVVQRTLDAEIDPAPFAQFQRMLSTATTLRLARFISKYLKLPAGTAEALAESIQPKQQHAFFFPNEDSERRSRPQNKAPVDKNLTESNDSDLNN